ncbi:hypothetical protein PYW08_008975 [Mythimna loreyi]|uniref:Uncharacterized protein n=1 Tax=Mythimna loreyi TaxID=667449 RepID=A0ACC2Q8H1_9NEOP|nr:hypothetical protein PYW08_008975 [Mythimna loreyi]
MNSILKLVVPCRVVRHIQQNILGSFSKILQPTPTRVLCVSARTMAQRSITSFFKVSPPKPVDKETKVEDEDIKVDDDKVGSPVKNGKTKPATKRARLESSESDTSPKKKTKSPSVSSDKKKKIKRQRIESSDSEADIAPNSESPISEEKAAASPSPEHMSAASPSPSPEKKPVIKVEKTKSPKTYASPKSKQKKPLTELNSIKKSLSPKKIKKEVVEDSKKENKKQDKVVKSANKSFEKAKDVKSEAKDLVPEVEYNPAKAKYHPIEDACWRTGQEVPYLALARTLELIEGTSARLKMIEILANYLRSVIVLTPEDLLPSVYMCLNQLAPSYESLELGIAETYLMKAIGQCTGRTLAQVRSAAQKCGDLGQVAEQARATQRTMFAPPPLTMRKVFAALKEIANMTGTASVNKKINKIQSLYVACRHSEARYLIRSLEGKLRIGLAEQSVLAALALATAATPPPHDAAAPLLDASKTMSPENFKARVDEHSLIIKTTYCECPSYDRIIPVLLTHGVAALPQHCRLTPGVPLKPMLAHPTKQVTHVFDRFEKEQFTCEWKYDGERAQIHVPGTDKPDFEHAAIFSRNQENNTSKYPDVLRRLPALLKDSVTSCVLDCEAVAYDTTTKQILPFQILSTRKRKDANEADIKVQVCVFIFDLLYLNGHALVRRPLLERRAALRDHLNEKEGEWQFATSKDCSTVEEVEQFMEEAMRGSCEGLMVKALSGDHARYDIARRSHNWLKLKKDYLEGVGDTLDVVVLGAYLGRGKRAGLYGGFLLACYDPTAEEFQTLCKIGTGFSDESLQTFTDTLKQHVIDAPRNYYRYDASHAPDVWFSARCVWEVRCADLSLSPAHRAAIGLVHSDKGISLRFPRFVRERTDKAPEQATSAQQIADLYLAQDTVKNSAAAAPNVDDFY